MKVILLLLLTLKVNAMDSKFYQDVNMMETDLSDLSAHSWSPKEFLEKQAKRIVHAFMNDKMHSEEIAQEFSLELSKNPNASVDDLIEMIKKFLIKIYGNKVSQVILMVLGFDEIKSAIEGIYSGYLLLQHDKTCEEGFIKLSSGMSFIAGFVAVFAAFQGQPYAIFLANAGGIISKEACKLVINVTDVDKITCGFIYQRGSHGF